MTRQLILSLLVAGLFAQHGLAKEPPARPKRVLFIGQAPDGHPPGTHEYRAGAGLLARLVRRVEDSASIQPIVVSADGDWPEGPELLDGADAVFLFVSQGAAWIQADARRLAAFQRLAKRKGGFVCLHWGMGTQEAKNIKAFVNLFGGCHGGPDRRYKVVDVRTEFPNPKHPILRAVKPIDVHEEFYFKLKQPAAKKSLTSLIEVEIEDAKHTVAWAWNRPDGGRSFGFTGLHFHENWKEETYRRLMTQGLLWTIGHRIPENGVPVPIEKKDLVPPQQNKVTESR